MAPFVSPSKQAVIHALKTHRHDSDDLPITLGKYQPQFVIRIHHQQYELVRLVLDEARAAEDRKRRTAEGYYMPEMSWAFLVPDVAVIQEADVNVFIKKLELWPGWEQLK
ncbi:MAG TPA: hypothetical protein VHL14_14780 [Steroidobacteraceae bacterium]|nr:hypothetical protein [Steroidobacteraceae bacterium]